MKIQLEEVDRVRAKGFRPVAVGCILRNSKILFVYKSEYKLWQLPQGGVDNGEDIEEALVREMSEELGVEFAESLVELDTIYKDRIEFPQETQGSRELETDSGAEVFMRGKIYYFVTAKTKVGGFELSEAEFDKYRWLNYDEALNFAENIYQKGKKRITVRCIKRLKALNLI